MPCSTKIKGLLLDLITAAQTITDADPWAQVTLRGPTSPITWPNTIILGIDMVLNVEFLFVAENKVRKHACLKAGEEKSGSGKAFLHSFADSNGKHIQYIVFVLNLYSFCNNISTVLLQLYVSFPKYSYLKL